MKKLKIVHVIPIFEIGGAQRMVVSFAREMLAEGHEVFAVVVREPQGCFLEDELSALGAKLIYLNKPIGFKPKFIWWLYRTLADISPDVVHSHMYSLRYLWLYILSHRGVRYVHTIHNTAKEDASRPYFFNRWFQKTLFRIGVQPVAISKEIQKGVKKFYNLKSCEMICNGIALSDDEGINTGPKTDGIFTFLCVATFKKQKNHTGLLLFFQALLTRRNNIRLRLIGDGPEFESSKDMAKTLGIDGQVEFLGSCSDIPQQLRRADVFILLSHHEGNPLCIMEAMAAGLPAIATPVGGIPDIIKDNKDGVLIRSQPDEESLHRVLFLIDNAEERMSLGAAARARAEAEFSDRTMSLRYLDLYAQ